MNTSSNFEMLYLGTDPVPGLANAPVHATTPIGALTHALNSLCAQLLQAVEAALRLGLTTGERVRRRLNELAAPGRAGVRRCGACSTGEPGGERRAAGWRCG